MNTWEQLVEAVKAGAIPREQAFSISWTGSQGRSPIAYYWSLGSPFRHAQDPARAAWYEKVGHRYAIKHFGGYGHRKEALGEAQRYAAELCGVTEWKRNRLSDYVPAAVNIAFPIPKSDV